MRGGREENEKRRNGQPRVARLAAGGSNCVINLKVRFSLSWERKRKRKHRGREREKDEEDRERGRQTE